MNINNSNFLSYKNNYIKRLRTNLKGFLEPGDFLSESDPIPGLRGFELKILLANSFAYRACG